MKTGATATEDSPEDSFRRGMARLYRAAGVLVLLALAAVVLILVIFMVQAAGKWGVISGGFVTAFTAVSVLALAPRRDD